MPKDYSLWSHKGKGDLPALHIVLVTYLACHSTHRKCLAKDSDFKTSSSHFHLRKMKCPYILNDLKKKKTLYQLFIFCVFYKFSSKSENKTAYLRYLIPFLLPTTVYRYHLQTHRSSHKVAIPPGFFRHPELRVLASPSMPHPTPHSDSPQRESRCSSSK